MEKIFEKSTAEKVTAWAVSHVIYTLHYWPMILQEQAVQVKAIDYEERKN